MKSLTGGNLLGFALMALVALGCLAALARVESRAQRAGNYAGLRDNYGVQRRFRRV